MASGKAWQAARVPPGRTTLSPDPKGCLGEVSTHATGAETRLAATRSREGTPRPGLGRGNRLTLGPDSEAESSDPSKRGETRDVSGWVTSRLKVLFSTRGQNISCSNLENPGGQVRDTSPSRHTSARSLFSTYPNFQTPPRPSIVSPYTHPIWDSEDHGPGRAFRPTPAPLEPSGQPRLTRLRPSTPR